MVGLSAIVGLGIPILGDFAALDLEEHPIGGVELSSAESNKIEEVTAGAQDRPWRRRIAKAP